MKNSSKRTKNQVGIKTMSKFDADLINAEEAWLKARGWVVDDNNMWEHPGYTVQFTRNHAVLAEKSGLV